jgi:hypothetical protein
VLKKGGERREWPGRPLRAAAVINRPGVHPPVGRIWEKTDGRERNRETRMAKVEDKRTNDHPHLRGSGKTARSGLGGGEGKSLFCSPASGTSDLPSPVSHLSLSGLQGRPPLKLMLVYASYEGRSRGLLTIRRPVPPAGRMKGMRHRWMRFEPCRPQAYLTYAGGHMAKSAPHRAYSLHPTGHTSGPHRA